MLFNMAFEAYLGTIITHDKERGIRIGMDIMARGTPHFVLSRSESNMDMAGVWGGLDFIIQGDIENETDRVVVAQV